MKKKVVYVSLMFSLFICNCSLVKALSFFDDSSRKDVCGLSLPSNVPTFTNGIFNLIKILVPIILIIMGMIDFARAVSANDEKKMSESKDKFIRRLIAAIFIFFIVAIVQFVFKSISKDSGFSSCMNCVLNNDCADSTEDYGASKKYCDEYTVYDCPASDSYGHSCSTSSYPATCRFVCATITDIKLCEKKTYCELNGTTCIDKVATGSLVTKEETDNSNENSNDSSNNNNNTASTSSTTSTCLSKCQKKKDKTAREKCNKECEGKQTKVSCDSCKKIKSSSSAQQACLKNCKPSTAKSKSTNKDTCSTRSVSTCTKSKDSNGSTCKVKNGKCTTK